MATTLLMEAELEQFTEADTESLEFATEDLEGLEAESTESISLEDVNPESVAESLESLMEEAESNGNTSLDKSKIVNNQLLKTFTIIVKKLVKKSMGNAKTRAKLQAATRKGPTAIARLLTPSVAKVLPPYFRWMAPIYVPSVTLALFGPLCKEVGVKAEEVEEAPEFIQFLPWIFRGLSLGANVYMARAGRPRRR